MSKVGLTPGNDATYNRKEAVFKRPICAEFLHLCRLDFQWQVVDNEPLEVCLPVLNIRRKPETI